jgi:DNA-directed RNA polymerase subunit H (RpoH/RPB5)
MTYARIFKTIEEMMTLRGFRKIRHDFDGTTRESIRIDYIKSENSGTNSDEYTIILFADQGIGLGKSQIQVYASRLEELGAKNGFIIVDSTGNKKAVSSIARNSLRSLRIPIEIFADHELVSNILQHELQPEFRIVHKDLHSDIFETFTTPDKLPKLRYDDPVARFIGCKIGDIVKTRQLIETGGCEIGYLAVV